MNQKLKIAAATAAVSITGLSLVACGSNSGTSTAAAPGSQLASDETGTTGQPGSGGMPPGGTPPGGAAGAGGPFASLTSDDIKCLKKQGVAVPPGPPAQNSASGNGKSGNSNGSWRHGRPSKADMPTPAAMKKAAKACGIDLPDPGTMGGPGGPASSSAAPLSTQQS